MHAGIAAADAGRFVETALARRRDVWPPLPVPLTVVAAGKAAASMTAGFIRSNPGPIAAALAVSTHGGESLPASIEWYPAGHPVPNDASERAGRRALDLAAAARGALVLLLSGGASSLLAVPRPGLALEDKRAVTADLLRGGADIHALNTVRKHLSAIKGGWLAVASRGPTLALAVSDVVDDDLSVIGSGPTVPDPTTFSDALAVLDRFGGRLAYPRAAVRLLEAGQAGDIPETPKPGDPRLSATVTRVIGSRHDVLRAAAAAASVAGYRAVTIPDALTGEARDTASAHLARMLAAAAADAPAAVITTGETTVHVTGSGRGGRNQELVLASAPGLATLARPAVFSSVGTDGIDGPTNAAGALADTTTVLRADEHGLSVRAFLDSNDSYTFFAALNDLIITGPTDTNVGDLQILLVG